MKAIYKKETEAPSPISTRERCPLMLLLDPRKGRVPAKAKEERERRPLLHRRHRWGPIDRETDRQRQKSVLNKESVPSAPSM